MTGHINTEGLRKVNIWMKRQICLNYFTSHPCQRDNCDINVRSYIQVHTDERAQVHNAQFSLKVTHANTNLGRRALPSVNVPLSYSFACIHKPECDTWIIRWFNIIIGQHYYYYYYY